MVRSVRGNPILTVQANSFPYQHFLDRRHALRMLWGKSFLVLTLLVLFVHAMVAIAKNPRTAWLRGVPRPAATALMIRKLLVRLAGVEPATF